MPTLINLNDSNVTLSVVEGDVVQVTTEDGHSNEISRLIMLQCPQGDYIHDYVYHSRIVDSEDDYYTESGETHAKRDLKTIKEIAVVDVDSDYWVKVEQDTRTSEQKSHEEWQREQEERY